MLLPILNALVYAGLAVGLGAIVVRFLLLPRCGLAVSEAAPPLRLAATGGAIAAAAVLVLAPLRVALQLAMLGEPGEPWRPLLGAILADTALGRAMQLQAIWAAAALMGFTIARVGRERGWKAAGIAMLVLAATPALGGHPAAAANPMLAVTVATVHVIAAGAWLGTLFHLWRSLCALSGATGAAMIKAFHAVALGAAGALLATGAYQTWSAIGSPADLVTTVWGGVLVAKLVGVGVIALLGRDHWRHAETQMARGESGAVRASFARELLFAAIVIVLSGVLSSTAPPG